MDRSAPRKKDGEVWRKRQGAIRECSPQAADRALLAHPAGATLAAASAKDRGLADHLARLRAMAQDKGSTRLIIGVRAAFAPEGELAESQAVAQRLDISQAQATVLQRLAAVHGGKKPATRFETIPFLALEASPAEFDTLATDRGVLSIEEDALSRTTLAESSPLIGATASSGAGHNGSGQAVAILDTGVDKTHPFLSGRVVSEACYSSNVASYSSITVCPGGVTDSTASGSGVNCGANCDHGTHVAGIVAGIQASFSGVARGASLIAVQVFSRFNSTTECGGAASCVLSYSSDQIKGLERVYALRGSYSIASVNMSLGGGRYTNQASCDSANSSIKAAIDNLRAAGIATVISSGNSAYTDSLGAPGCVSSAISVGSTWDTAGQSASWSNCSEASSTVNKVACYSNSASFLNLLAPGSAINSSVPGGGYAVYHGTSMAAPQVAGAWAVLKQASPGLSVSNALNMLASTGVSVTDYRNSLVKKRIDLVAALASLNPAATYTLTVSSSGAAGVAIAASPAGYAGTTNYSKTGIATGTAITLTAPVMASGSTFIGWSGCDSVSSVTCTVTMYGAKSVTALYSYNLLQNPGFESGHIAWAESSSGGYPLTTNSTTRPAHSGAYYAYLGGYDSAIDSIEQSVTIPASASSPNVDFWYQISTDETGTTPYDSLEVGLYNAAGTRLTALSTLSNLNASTGWVKSPSFDLSAYKGQAVRLRFTATTNGTNSTSFFIDDVSLASELPLNDSTPDPFSFTPQTGVALNATITSNPITVSGINATAPVEVSNGSYSVNSLPFVSVIGSVSSGDTVRVNILSASMAGAVRTAVLTIGGVSDSFSVTTGKGGQTIAFGAAPTGVVVGGTGSVSASASSGLAVSYSSSTATICTVSGSTVTGVKAGTCTIAASQPGDSNYNPAVAVAQNLTVGKGSSTTILTALPGSPILKSTLMTLTAQVSGQGRIPTGDVEFKDGTIPLGTGHIGVNGIATYTSNALIVGTHTLTASYTGDLDYLVSQGSISNYRVTSAIDTTTTLRTTPNPSQPGQSVTVAVNVSAASNGGALTGSVAVSGNGQSCSLALPETSCTLTFAEKGVKKLTAVYSGNSLYATSTGAGNHYVGKRPSLTPILMLLLD